MAKKKATRLVRDSAYEQIGPVYQLLQIDVLNESLKDNGIGDPELRRKICRDFVFGLGIFHDQHWFVAGGRTVYPLLCFSQRFLDVDTDVGMLGDVLAPPESFAFHEHACGRVHAYFEERAEETGDILSGCVGFEISEAKRRQVHKRLERRMTVDEAQSYFRDKDERNDGCEYFGTWAEAFQNIIHTAMKPDDQIWWYNAARKDWDSLRGEMGVALVRGQNVVTFLIVGRS